MPAIGQRLHVRAFLEGVEIPVISVSIQSQKNAPAVASLQIPAADAALDLLPRTLVHIYAYDAYQGAPPEQQVYAFSPSDKLIADPDKMPVVPDNERSLSEITTEDLENENYKLIFGGEVMGFSYTKSPRSRGIVLQCVDWSNYWDIAYQYQIGGFSFGGGSLRAAFTGASTTVFNDFLEGSGDIVKQLLETPPRSYPQLKGSLLGAIMHLIEAIGGCYYGKNAIRGTNDFFSLAEIRLHLTQMVAANKFSSKDEIQLLSANGFGSLFSKTLGGLGKLVTVRQVLLALQRYIFHEIVPITSPRYVPPLEDPNTPQRETVPISADRETLPLHRAADYLRTRCLELRQRQEKCLTSQDRIDQSDTRGGLQAELTALSAAATEASRTARRVGLRGSGTTQHSEIFGVAEIAKAMDAASRQFGTVISMLLASTGRSTIYFPRAESSTAVSIRRIFQDIADSMLLVLDAKHTRRVQRTVAQSDPPARLYTQIYRPDVWMVAPPRCNVLFPELYSEFSYGRNFQAEVSRMMLRTHSAFMGSDELFDGFYMAPNAMGARTGKKIAKGRVNEDPDLAAAPPWVTRDLMDHELYTGIIPTFERMSDLNLHAIRGGKIELNGAKVSYAALACNHIFFQYRFKSRQLMLSGKFNPYFVLGFPAVVIDKYLAADQLRGTSYENDVASRLAELYKSTGSFDLPRGEQQGVVEVSAADADASIADIVAARSNTHYLGTPELVSHSVSASSGGNTQIQMAYARTTDEKNEFLGEATGKTVMKQKSVARIPTVVAAFEPPKEGAPGFLGGNIISVKDVTDRYQKKQPKKAGSTPNGRYGSNQLLPLYVAEGGYSGRKRRGTRVPVGVTQPANAYGPEVVALVGSGGLNVAADGAIDVTFRAYEIKEEVGSYVRENVDLPVEDLVFPPWYGEHYRTRQVGGLYSDFFGVGAITDPTTIVGLKSGQTFSTPSEARTLFMRFEQALSTPSSTQPEFLMPNDLIPSLGLSSTPTPADGGIIGPLKEPDQKIDSVLGKVQARSPIRLAVEELVRTYSACRSNGFDTPQFVQNYTWRPIASLIDMFGTSDLEIDDTGTVVTGREGFHSRAFGDEDNLRLLAGGGEGPVAQRILGLEVKQRELGSDREEEADKISERLDTRKEKRQRVYRLVFALAASRGVVLG